MVKKAVILLLPVLLFGCELFLSPQHSNPFDTGFGEGKFKRLLTAVRTPTQFQLSWEKSGDTGFTGYDVVTSVMRDDIAAVARDPGDISSYPSVTVLITLYPASTTVYNVPTAGLNGLHHYAVIYRTLDSDLARTDPKASNIVTYEK